MSGGDNEVVNGDWPAVVVGVDQTQKIRPGGWQLHPQNGVGAGFRVVGGGDYVSVIIVESENRIEERAVAGSEYFCYDFCAGFAVETEDVDIPRLADHTLDRFSEFDWLRLAQTAIRFFFGLDRARLKHGSNVPPALTIQSY